MVLVVLAVLAALAVWVLSVVLALMGVLALVLTDSGSANLAMVVMLVACVVEQAVSSSVSCGANLAAVAGTTVPQFLDKVEDEPGG